MNRLLLLGWLSLLGCGGSLGQAPECIDNGDCGALQACVDQVCADVACLSTIDCDLEQYCDLEHYTCVDGCEVDRDCRAGFECSSASRTCEPQACRSTQLDCAFGENCNLASGECELDEGGHCDPCTTRPFQPRGTCADERAVCTEYFTEPGTFCFLQCESELDCPRGFECQNVGRDASGDGRIDYLCVAHCQDLYDNDWL